MFTVLQVSGPVLKYNIIVKKAQDIKAAPCMVNSKQNEEAERKEQDTCGTYVQ